MLNCRLRQPESQGHVWHLGSRWSVLAIFNILQIPHQMLECRILIFMPDFRVKRMYFCIKKDLLPMHAWSKALSAHAEKSVGNRIFLRCNMAILQLVLFMMPY